MTLAANPCTSQDKLVYATVTNSPQCSDLRKQSFHIYIHGQQQLPRNPKTEKCEKQKRWRKGDKFSIGSTKVCWWGDSCEFCPSYWPHRVTLPGPQKWGKHSHAIARAPTPVTIPLPSTRRTSFCKPGGRRVTSTSLSFQFTFVEDFQHPTIAEKKERSNFSVYNKRASFHIHIASPCSKPFLNCGFHSPFNTPGIAILTLGKYRVCYLLPIFPDFFSSMPILYGS